MQAPFIIDIFAQIIFVFVLAYYGMTNMQWYNYSFKRVIFMHHKWHWHIFYCIIPLGLYVGLFFASAPLDVYGLFALSVLYTISVIIWAKKLDRRLVFTPRVIKFYLIFIAFVLLNIVLNYIFGFHNGLINLMPLLFASVISKLYEDALRKQFIALAREKLNMMTRLNIIAVTGSYGKTSMKNFLAQILREKYSVYATPRSVNTHTGIIADINKHLDYTTEVYIIEAGARLRGDIAEIVQSINPHYVVIGEIGEQHLEYFKSLDNIIDTKYEILQSKNLKKAFIYKDNPQPPRIDSILSKKIAFFPENVRNVKATLEGTSFELLVKDKWQYFECAILGAFNVINLSAAIYVAFELGLHIEDITRALKRIEPVPHRLHKMRVNQKTILDDSFNGNLKGMKEAIRLSSLYKGRKIIITPGIVESTKEANIELAKAIDKVFDIAIITGELNAKILSRHIKNAQKIILKDKTMLEEMLKSCSKPNDLVLFSNDAPSYI